MTDKNTSVSLKPADELRKFFDKNMDKITSVLPAGVDAHRYMTIAMNSIWQNELLRQCNPYTLFNAVMEVAKLGLEVGGYRGQACIVPFYNSKKGCYEAKSMVMYQGYIDLWVESSDVADVRARIVYAKDKFHVEYGLVEKLEHIPNFDEDKGEPIGAYAVIRYKDGRTAFDYMPRQEIEKVKNTSQAVRKGWNTPWNDPVGELEMWKKTVIKRTGKLVARKISPALREIINNDDELEFGAIKQSISENLEKKIEEKTDRLAESLPAAKAEKETEPEQAKDTDDWGTYPSEDKCPTCGYALSVCGCSQEPEPKKKGRQKKEPEQMEIK